MAEHPRRAAFNAAGILSAVAGAALFAIVIWRADPRQVWQGILGVGWWFVAIVAIGGLRFLTRALAWMVCIEPPHRLSIGSAFAGVVAGDTIGNLTPLGPVLGEPAKAAYVRSAVPGAIALAALAVENLIYALSAAALIAVGILALLLSFDPPDDMRRLGQFAVALFAVVFVVLLLLLWRPPVLLSRWIPLLSTFASRRPGALATAAVFEGLFHALGVMEAYITVRAITGDSPGILVAFILETTQRVIMVLFKVVPFQMGVGELGTAAITNVLGLGGTIGVTVAVIRKARMGAWALLGGLLLARRGIR